MKVLLVDDDPGLREILGDILKMKGIESVPAETGADALARIERQDIDVALIDLKLEDMSGLDVLRGIKERSPDTECILLTGYASQATAIQAVNLGAYAYFQKPYDVEQLLVVIRRAAEKRVAEEAFKKSEERYRDLVENSQDLICTHDLQGNLLFINEAGTKISGYSNATLLKMNLRDILAPEVRGRFEAYLAELQARGQAHGLMRIQTAAGEIRYLEFKNTLQTEALAAPIVRGTARDVTERTRAEKALRESEKKYHVLTEISPVGIFRTDAQGSTTYVNPRWSQISGLSADEALGDGWLRAVHPEDREKLGEGWKQAARAQVPSISEYRFVRPDGSIAWVLGQATPERNIEDQVVGYVGTITDITELKKIQKKLAASEAELRALFASMQDVVLVIDREGVYRMIAPTNPGLLVRPPEELLDKNLLDVFPAEQAKICIEAIRQTLETRETAQIEYELNIEGCPVWFSTSISPMDKDSTLWVARDITERKRAGDELRSLSTRQEAILAAVPDILMEVDKDKVYTWANQAGIEFFGEDVIGQKAAFYFEGEQDTYDQVKPLFNGGENVVYLESWQKRKDGEKRLLAWRRRVLKGTDGNVIGALSSAHDITERKRAEAELRESEEMLRESQRIAGLGSYALDFASGMWTSSNILDETFGIDETYERSIGGWAALIHPDDRDQMLDYFTNEIAGKLALFDKEYRIIRDNDKAERWVHGLGKLELDERSQPVRLRGTILDITERKHAEQALENSERRFRALIENGLDFISLLDAQGNLVWESPSSASILNYRYNEFIGRSLFELMHPDDLEWTLREFEEIVKQPGHQHGGRFRLRRADGTWRWVEAVVTNFLQDPSVGAIVVNYRDITERKQAEESLAASEAELRALFASMQDVVLVIDREGVYRKIAPTRPELLYKPPEELLGKTLRDVFPAEQAEAFLEAIRQTLETRQTTRIEYELTISGRPIWFSASISPMNNDSTLWVAHDITNRKQAEQEIRRRAAEFAALYESSQALAGDTSLEDVLKDITESARRLFGVTGVGLYLYDPASRMLEVKVDTHPSIPIGTRLSLGEGLAGKVAQTRRAMRIDDYATWEGRSPKYEGIPVRATLETPLIYQDELVGVLVAHETGDSQRKFTEADERLASLFAAQAAAAIQNARLFEDLRLRLAEMETLQAVASACMAAEDEDTLLDGITQLISETLYPDNFGFVMMGENGAALLPHPSYRGVTLESIPAQIPLEGSLAGRVAASGKPLRSGDVRKEEVYLEINPATRSEICVPMLAGERVLGVINAESHQAGRFSAQDERLLTILAGQVATALECLRLQRETLRRLRELQVLLEVSQAATRVLELEPLLQNALDVAVKALPAAEKGCLLLADSAGNLQIHAMSGYRDRRILGSSFPPSSGYSARAFRERQPLIIAEARREDEIRYDGEIEEMLQIQSAIVAPLMAQDRPIGVIALDNAARVNAFGADDLRLLTTIAANVSVAIQNARLFEQTNQRVVELKMLYESGLALSQLLSPKEIGQKIIELLEQKMDWHHTAIRLCRPQDDTLELLAFKQPGLDGEAEKRAVEERFKTLVSKSGEGLSGWAVQNSQTVRSGDVGNDPRYMDTYPGLHSGLYVPMKSGQRMIGVISIESEQPNAFSEADERLVSTLAAQAAGALENARLFEETRQRVKELETLNRVSIALRAVSKQEAMLAVVLEETLNALDASDGSINLLNNATGKLRQTIARGWPSEFSEAPIQPGEGLFGNVFASGNTRVTRDFANDPLTRPEMRSRLPAGWGGACIPIRSTEQTLGVMLIAIPGGREFSKEQVRLLNTLAEMTGNALQRASLLEETLRRLENMQALREVDQAIASSFDLRLILNTVLSHALTQLGVDAADVLSLNPIPQTLEYAAGFGFHTRGIERATSRLGKGHAGRAVLERQTVHVPNLPETGSNFLRASLLAGENFLEYYGVPLLSKGKVKGVLEVFHRSPLSPNPEWLELLETLAGQAAIAIDNAQLFENLQGANLELSLAYDATIEGWSRAMDLRDHETEGHTRRVTEMTMKLAQAFGVSDQELLHIRRGALLHDIGKMGVPDHILLKPDKLVDVEWALMQKHPQLAYEMLQPIQYLRESLDIPYCHHEKWDGTGYPQGLKGERIPLAARLFAIVDVYDALTSDRPYRKAWPKAKAIKYIRGLSGLQFDPQVVDKFMEMFGDEKSKV